MLSRLPILQRCLGLAVLYALFWAIVHHLAVRPFLDPSLLFVQILLSTLVFFLMNGLFLTFGPYRRGWIFQVLVSSFYVHPFFQLFYYRTYKSFLDQQNLSLVIREPYFLVKVFAMETTWTKGLVLLAGTLAAFALNRYVMRWKGRARGPKPYDLFLNKWALGFTFVMIVLQVKWCLDHDTTQLGLRPFYPVAIVALVSIFGYLLKARAALWQRGVVGALIVISITHLYVLNLAAPEARNRMTMDHQYFRALFGAFFVQAAFGDLAQDDQAREKFHRLPMAKMDYNILVALNDTQRWDHLSTNGFPRETDEALKDFVGGSFNFKFPVSPSNSTDTAVPALLTGLASDRDVRQIKGSLALWDFFAKGAETFFISSQDVTWSKLNLYYASIGQKYVWSRTAQPDYHGNPEDTNDMASALKMKEYLPTLKGPWVGVWQTFASHFPYTVNPEYERYTPCRLDRADPAQFENCYLNAQVYSAALRAEVFKALDLRKTVVIMTSDHGEGLGEHGIYFHGVDFHQEMVKVPFVIFIPQEILKRLPPQAVANLRANTEKIISTTDLVPTMVHLHELLTGQPLAEDRSLFTGRSLFDKWDYRVVFSSYCFPQYRCYSREILFADDEYYVIFRPSEGFHAIYSTWGDLKQEHPLTFAQIDPSKFERLVNEAAHVHASGEAMKAYYENLKANGFKER